ncbi:MAG: DUF3299 domain-containing protein [Pirellula sp.]
MNQTTLERQTNIDPEFQEDDEFNYQSLSRAAVLSIAFGLFGLLAWISPLLMFLPLLGLVFALAAFRNLKRFPLELVGRPLAWIGFVLSLLLCIGAPIRHIYIYYTEVPEGFERIQFSSLISPVDVPPPEAVAMHGKKIFVKGYIHPTSVSSNTTKSFVIVPDLGTCCFGTQPPLTHMIEVRLVNDKFASKSLRRYSLAGTLEVHPYKKPVEGLDGVYYHLDAEHFN